MQAIQKTVTDAEMIVGSYERRWDPRPLMVDMRPVSNYQSFLINPIVLRSFFLPLGMASMKRKAEGQGKKKAKGKAKAKAKVMATP